MGAVPFATVGAVAHACDMTADTQPDAAAEV
jgi:hypothetical protein